MDATLLLPVVVEHTIDERSPLYGEHQGGGGWMGEVLGRGGRGRGCRGSGGRGESRGVISGERGKAAAGRDRGGN